MLPLHYPPDWPPQSMPPLQFDHWAARIPIIGQVAIFFANHSHYWNHIEKVWGPIENNIIQQIEGRPALQEQGAKSKEEKIVMALAKAACQEKGISPPRELHPDDPGVLLMWGPFDDITPLIFRMNLEKSPGIKLTTETAYKICEPGLTVSEIADLVLAQEAASLTSDSQAG